MALVQPTFLDEPEAERSTTAGLCRLLSSSPCDRPILRGCVPREKLAAERGSGSRGSLSRGGRDGSSSSEVEERQPLGSGPKSRQPAPREAGGYMAGTARGGTRPGRRDGRLRTLSRPSRLRGRAVHASTPVRRAPGRQHHHTPAETRIPGDECAGDLQRVIQRAETGRPGRDFRGRREWHARERIARRRKLVRCRRDDEHAGVGLAAFRYGTAGRAK